MKRLFVLRQYRKGPVIPDLYFDNKMEAKKRRNMLGGRTVVSYGPDHRLFNNTSEVDTTEITNHASESSD